MYKPKTYVYVNDQCTGSGRGWRRLGRTKGNSRTIADMSCGRPVQQHDKEGMRGCKIGVIEGWGHHSILG